MDIIIFSGQSNMQGQSEALTSTTPVANAYEYKWVEDTFVPLKNPVGENITYDKKCGFDYVSGMNQNTWLEAHVTGAPCYGNTNLVPTFCKIYTEITGNTVVAVHIAKGSTVIADWMPGSAGYQIIVEKASAAIKKAELTETVERIFFVWLQGESDAIFRSTKAYYKEKISELCAALKADIGVQKFGMIRVGRFTKDERDLEIISAQDEVCLENDDFLMLTDIATQLNTEKEYMNPYVGGHYSAKGLEKLGYEAGKTLGEFVKNK